LRSVNLPIARTVYDRQEEQVFREHVRRGIQEAGNLASVTSESLRFAIMPVYADDTAAGVGGLVQGNIYRTATGVLMIKL
jgi:hypothetical protein